MKAVITKRALSRLARQGGKKYLRETVSPRMKDFTPCWDVVEEMMFRNEEEVFDREGNVPTGEWSQGAQPWAETHPSNYRTWKRQWYPGRKTLELTGRLRANLTGQDGKHYVSKRKKGFTFGSDLKAQDGSGYKSWYYTRGVTNQNMPDGQMWSMDRPGQDIGGAQTMPGTYRDGALKGVPIIKKHDTRQPIIIASHTEDAVIDVLIDHATDTDSFGP